jgi:putative transposase
MSTRSGVLSRKFVAQFVVNNYATHKHPKVRAWLARRPRWHIHFTPTYASRLNQVERFFALITQRAIRRGSFDSTTDLVKKIDRFIRTHNANSRPFVWTGYR